MRKLGIDIGSTYLGGVIVENEKIIASRYLEHKGEIEAKVNEFLKDARFGKYDVAGITGGASSQSLDSTLAVVEGVKFLLPGCRNVFSVGAETFSLIFFDERGKYREHSLNPPCASGTGSFIEQQARRLDISVVELSGRARDYRGKTPLIATRCAVFAKTDIIHAMQEGHSLDAICAGLCEGIARNVLDVLVKGRDIKAPVGIVGGVSLNAKITNTIGKVIDIQVVVPEYSHLAGAVGAALLGKSSRLSLDFLNNEEDKRRVRSPLQMKLSDYPDFSEFHIFDKGGVEIFLPHQGKTPTEIYLGLDIGSTSTKAVLIDSTGEIAGGFYTTTGGEPISAVKKLLTQIDEVFDLNSLCVHGAGTTGSGRKIIAELFCADLEINEITAHARAAVLLHPDVDTIVEIGGQDSKFTRIRRGDVYYSTMNYVCAAGTGSFIEEQAKRLGVCLSEFSDMALGAKAPYTSDRCTVYMERDLSALLSQGWSKEALAAAVLNSVRDNYLAKVVSKSPIGDYVVFQGATARNAALVASFENSLKKPVHVSPYCHLTGALGVALLCQEARLRNSRFIRDIRNIDLFEEECTLCANHCLLTVAKHQGKKSAWGMKCGREYGEKAKKKTKATLQKRFDETMHSLYAVPIANSPRKNIKIGIAKSLYNVEYAPLWHNFLSRLGFSTLLGSPSRKTLAEGKGLVNSDFCAPMVISHGAVKKTLDMGADYVFCPALANENDPDSGENDRLFKTRSSDAYFCYYSQYLPTIVGNLTAIDISGKMISPLIHFNHKQPEQIAANIHKEMAKHFDLSLEETTEAFLPAYELYLQTKRNWANTYRQLAGQSGAKLQVVILGRPYIAFDPVLNLDLAVKLEELGAEVFWQDEFDLDKYDLGYANQFYERMHWHYGKQILKTAEYCAHTENLFAVYLTCFRCSPDAFLISYVKDIMSHYHKPFLVLQLDEHSSDIGYTTRIEAGMRSFENHLRQKTSIPSVSVSRARDDRLAKGDTVLVAYLDRLISRFWVNSFIRMGFDAMLLDIDEKALNTGYKYASGGECMPLVSIVGGVIEKVRATGLNPQKVFFYMPTVCMACNFPQFPIFADLAFRSAKIDGVKIGLINSMAPGDALPGKLTIKILECNIVGCIVYKMYNRTKAYEKRKGDSKAVFEKVAAMMSEGIVGGKGLRAVLGEAVELFRDVELDKSQGKKPRIGLIGDLYVKYNEAVNQNVQDLVDKLGGELISPSLTEYPFHFYDADVRLHGDDPRQYRLLRKIEQRYEKIAADLIGDQFEPDFAECVRLMEDYGINHYIPGETSISVGRAIYYIHHHSVEAIIHVNPMFCCPGVVTSSIYRKIQKDFDIPIIDIFYDGTGKPNNVLIPHMHYLKGGKPRK